MKDANLFGWEFLRCPMQQLVGLIHVLPHSNIHSLCVCVCVCVFFPSLRWPLCYLDAPHGSRTMQLHTIGAYTVFDVMITLYSNLYSVFDGISVKLKCFLFSFSFFFNLWVGPMDSVLVNRGGLVGLVHALA